MDEVVGDEVIVGDVVGRDVVGRDVVGGDVVVVVDGTGTVAAMTGAESTTLEAGTASIVRMSVWAGGTDGTADGPLGRPKARRVANATMATTPSAITLGRPCLRTEAVPPSFSTM